MASPRVAWPADLVGALHLDTEYTDDWKSLYAAGFERVVAAILAVNEVGTWIRNVTCMERVT